MCKLCQPTGACKTATKNSPPFKPHCSTPKLNNILYNYFFRASGHYPPVRVPHPRHPSPPLFPRPPPALPPPGRSRRDRSQQRFLDAASARMNQDLSVQRRCPRVNPVQQREGKRSEVSRKLRQGGDRLVRKIAIFVFCFLFVVS